MTADELIQIKELLLAAQESEDKCGCSREKPCRVRKACAKVEDIVGERETSERAESMKTAKGTWKMWGLKLPSGEISERLFRLEIAAQEYVDAMPERSLYRKATIVPVSVQETTER